MKKIISTSLSLALLLSMIVMATVSSYAAAVDSAFYNPLVVFDNTLTPAWAAGDATAAVSYTSSSMTVVPNTAWGYVTSGNGFVRNMTSDGGIWDYAGGSNKQIDVFRVYVKNPGGATDMYLQFANGYNEIWWLCKTVPTSSEYVAVDYPLDEFTFRFGGSNPSLTGGQSWASARTAGLQDGNTLQTFNMQMIVNVSGSTLEFSKITMLNNPKNETARFVYDFRNASAWTPDSATVSLQEGTLRFANTGSYGTAASHNGFVKQLTADGTLTDRDMVRVYVKNPGSAVDLRLHYSDGYAIARHNTQTIAGGSSAYVAYDFPLGDFATPDFDQTGTVSTDTGNLHPANTKLKDDPYRDSNSLETFRVTLQFFSTSASTLLLADMAAVRYAEGAGDTFVDGEPAHTVNYDVFEDFNSYADTAAMKAQWINDGSTALFDLVSTTGGGKTASFSSASSQNAVHLRSFASDSERAKYDRVRLWAKGTGRLFIQLNMPVPLQTNGAAIASFMYEVPVSAAGGVHELAVSSFTLPDWWGTVGNDTTLVPDMTKINGMYMVYIGGTSTGLLVDNLGWMEADSPPVLDTRAGEPAHTVDYDLFEGFEGYSDKDGLKSVWQDSGSHPGTDLVLVNTEDGGKAAMFTAGLAGQTATHLHTFTQDSARAKYDRLRIWAKGTGRLFVQLNVPVPAQTNGATVASFVYELTVTAEGSVNQLFFSDLSLPDWWGTVGNDTSVTLDPAKINGIYLVYGGADASELVLDNIGWMEPSAETVIIRNGEPEHEIYYEVIDDFNQYSDTTDMKSNWKNVSTSSGAQMRLIDTKDGGKAALLASDSGGKLITYRLDFPADKARDDYDTVRMWAAGDGLGGRLYLQINMECPLQPNGETWVTFLRPLQTIASGQIIECKLNSFSLPDWWKDVGNDTTLKPDMTKINGIYLVLIADNPADFVIDNLGFCDSKRDIHPEVKPEPEGKELLLDNFDQYGSDKDLKKVWGSSFKKMDPILLTDDGKGGKMLGISADDMTTGVRVLSVSERSPADLSGINALRFWAKGNGETVTVRLLCPVEEQEDGTDRLPLVFLFAAPLDGAVITVPFNELSLPDWWTEENGFDSEVDFRLDNVTDFSFEVVGGKGSKVFFDDLRFIGTGYTINGTSFGTGDAAVLLPFIAGLLLSGAAIILMRKKRKSQIVFA